FPFLSHKSYSALCGNRGAGQNYPGFDRHTGAECGEDRANGGRIAQQPPYVNHVVPTMYIAYCEFAHFVTRTSSVQDNKRITIQHKTMFRSRSHFRNCSCSSGVKARGISESCCLNG